MVRLANLFLLISAPAFAESWSGILVDSNCYISEERNVNKNTSSIEHDVNLEVRLCAPNSGTKEFGIVLVDPDFLRLDSDGNARAAELLHNAGKRSMLRVTVTGGRAKDTIKASSISTAK